MCLRWPSNTFFFFTVSDGFCNNLRSILILSYCLMSSPTSCIVFKWQNYWNFLYSWKRNQEMLVNSKTEMYTFNFVLVLKILVKLVKCIGANIPLAPLFGVAILCNPGWSLVSCEVEDDFECPIFPPLAPKCWCYRCALPYVIIVERSWQREDNNPPPTSQWKLCGKESWFHVQLPGISVLGRPRQKGSKVIASL